MDVHRLRNLTFLMSLGGLSAACFTDEGPRGNATDPGESTGGTTGGTTDAVDPGTTTTTTDADTTTTTTGAVDTTGPAEPATSTTTGPDTTTTDLTTTATTGPGPGGDVCMQYGTTYVGCYPRQAQYLEAIVEDCEAVVEKGDEVDGPTCGKAYEDFYACLAALDCQQLEFEYNNLALCAIQYELIEEFCPVTGKDF